jgi:hypothetical protein
VTASDTERTKPARSASTAPGSWVRFVGAVCLLGAAAATLAAGPALPTWIIALGRQSSLTGDDTARWLAAGWATLGVMVALSPRFAPGPIFIGGVSLAFIGLATLSGALAPATRAAGQSSIGVVIGLAVTAVGLLLVGVIGPHAGRSTSPVRRGVSTAWHVLATIALLAGLLIWMPQAPMRTTAPMITVRDFSAPDSTAPRNTVEFVSFEFDRWEGQSIEAVGLFEYMPALRELLAGVAPSGRVYLVFYNPRCGHCHDLFREHFSGHLDAPVIAIEVPPPPGGTLVETDEPTAIDCPECHRIALPATYAWGVTPPAVVRLDSGIITCASESTSFTPKGCVDEHAR